MAPAKDIGLITIDKTEVRTKVSEKDIELSYFDSTQVSRMAPAKDIGLITIGRTEVRTKVLAKDVELSFINRTEVYRTDNY